jgi:hypothetical protein
MIDNEKVKNALAGWAKFPIYSKAETDFFDQCGYIGNFSRNEVITFYSGYAARDKEAEEEKRELILYLVDLREWLDLSSENYIASGSQSHSIMIDLIEKHTGKTIEEVVSDDTTKK